MKGIKCQLCNGIIINGRCRVCGMPYRNDEVLYHLNESSHDHYKHATSEAKEMMRQNRIPLGDKNTSASGKSKNISGKNSQISERLMSKDQIKAHQEKIRQEAMAKINSTKMPNKKTTTKPQKKKKGVGAFWWIIIIFYIIMNVVSKEL